MLLVVPLSVGVWRVADQFAVPKFEFCCKVNPVDEEGQETTTALVGVKVIVKGGAPGVGTAEIMPQKPPTIV